jgi:hypothetical protein
VIDGTVRDPIDDAAVVIDGGRISAVVETSQLTRTTRDAHTEIDVGDATSYLD